MPQNRVREGDRRPKSRAVQSEKGRSEMDRFGASQTAFCPYSA